MALTAPGTPRPRPSDVSGGPLLPVEAYLTRAPDYGLRTVQCFILRDRAASRRMRPVYRLYLEKREGNEDSHFFPVPGRDSGPRGAKLLMSARRKMQSKTSHYVISSSKETMDPLEGDPEDMMGKLRANWSGSTYTIYDKGAKPGRAGARNDERLELGILRFGYDQMGPGRIRAAIPRVGEDMQTAPWRANPNGEGGIESAVEHGRIRDLIFLENKRPKWDAVHGGHVLNFRGRVTASSVKNFQLACAGALDRTVLQFGRVSKDRFTLDFSYPLNALQAFAIVLASLDGKIADSKSFEAMKKLREDHHALDRAELKEPRGLHMSDREANAYEERSRHRAEAKQ